MTLLPSASPGRPCGGRPGPHVLLPVLLACLATACGEPQEGPPAAPAPAGTGSEAAAPAVAAPAAAEPALTLRISGLPDLEPVPDPEVGDARPEVRQQIDDQRAVVEELLNGPPDPAAAADAFAQLGFIFIAYEYLDAAETCLSNSRRLVADDYRWTYLSGYLLKMKGRVDEAAALLERSLEMHPDDVPALVRLGDSRLELGDPEAARPLYQRALELRPESAGALQGLARLAAHDGDQGKAAELYRRALELQPGATSLHYALGQTWRKLGDLEKARFHLERRGDNPVLLDDPLIAPIAKLGRSASFYLVQAGEAMQNRQFDEAAEHYRKALEYDAADFKTHLGLSYCLRQMGDPDAALAQLREALAQGKAEDPLQDRRWRAEIHRAIAGVLVNQGRDREAIEHLEVSLEKHPERNEVRSMLADAMARLRRFEEAAEQYDRILKTAPDDVQVRVKRATVLMNLGRHDAALDDFRRATELAPDDARLRVLYAEALRFLGRAEDAGEQLGEAREHADGGERAQLVADEARRLLERGELEAAANGFREALELDPKLSEARFGLASVLGHLGRNAEARAEFSRLLEADPHHRGAHRGRIVVLLLEADYFEAKLKLRDALEVFSRDVELAHGMARLLAAAPDAEVRDGKLAVNLAQRVVQTRRTLATGATLAMAQAEAGRFEDAVATVRGILADASLPKSDAEHRWLGEQLAAYERQQPWRVGSPDEIIRTLGGP